MYDIAIPFIAQYEGLELSPYYCPAFKLTIGYGELIRENGKYGTVYGSRIIKVGDNLHKEYGKNRTGLNQALKNVFGNIITIGDAQGMMKHHLEYKWRQIANHLPTGLTNNQCAAIISLVYNIGVTAFLNSTVFKRVNAGDMQGAGNAFLRFNLARIDGVLKPLSGLTRRRKEERELFLK